MTVSKNLSKWRHNLRWRVFDFIFSKYWKKSEIKDFSISCQFNFNSKILTFLEKINGWRKNQNGGQKLKWR
jgi:hypothetical protein